MNKVKGKVLNVSTKTGNGKNGEWKNTTVVVETASKYNNTVPISFFNKDVNVKEGDEVEVDVYIGGRSYEGRYYPQIDGNEISVVSNSSGASTSSREEAFESESGDSGLPF
jgi:RecG-like helicase